MNFKDAYPDAQDQDEPEQGLVCFGQPKPCSQCGKPTEFVDISAESYFCSHECMNNFWREFWIAENAIEDVIRFDELIEVRLGSDIRDRY